LKLSLIYDVFSNLIFNLSISSLANKFYLIAIEFGKKNKIATAQKKKFKN
jgi:hypothetical protein